MHGGDSGAVIVVDDVPNSLERLQSLVLEIPELKLAGSAATPEAAIELARTTRSGIMILDLFLTDGTGIEVLEAIRELRLDTRVVVVTGDPSDALRDACLGLGARFFFDKVFEFDEIQPALRSLLVGASVGP